MILSAFNKLNRHTKIAIFVAPVLMVLGFAASDLWVENKAMKPKFFMMQPENNQCDILAKQCVLVVEDFKISVYLEDGLTTLNSTFPLDTATLFFVDENDNATTYRMGMKDSPYYWYQVTNIEDTARAGEQKVRLIATIKGGQYIAEFVSKSL
ncbi:MAG: hypothetical protein WA981_06400 [Glaciecola sp.]